MDRLGEARPPGYTGYLPGKAEVFGRTPALAQTATALPSKVSVLAARSAPPLPPRAGATASNPASLVTSAGSAPNLWPDRQSTPADCVGESAKPQVSTLAAKLGDERIPAYVSSYASTFVPPFAGTPIRSPLRNTALAGVADLRAVYRSALGRVGEKRLDDIHHHMRERLQGKMGNKSDNAFRLRKLFRMYDEGGSGFVDLESFRTMVESFGMQFDDDSLLALFSQYDPEGSGTLRYHALMKRLLDEDTYRLWCGGQDPLTK